MSTTATSEAGNTEFSDANKALDAALANDRLPSCALDEEGVRAQQARHARLAPSVTSLERGNETLSFGFAEGFDRQALAEMVAVEKQCCPFFEFSFDQRKRKLSVGVKQREMLPALEAIASHLGARWEGPR